MRAYCVENECMACPLEDVGNENKCEDCEGEVHEPAVVRSCLSNVWLPTKPRP